VETGACPSKGDARRQLQQNAIRVNGAAVTEDAPVQGDQFREGKFLVIKRGKRNNYLARLTG
jgi:tyrosyl-tRNA synthetase